LSGYTQKLLHLLFRFDWITGLLPSVETTGEGMHIGEAMIAEGLRHPGATSLVRSRAVGDDGAILGQLWQMLLYGLDWHAQGARQLDVRGCPRLRVARVDEKRRLALYESGFDLINRGSRRLKIGSNTGWFHTKVSSFGGISPYQ
jgi:hypothetical protein